MKKRWGLLLVNLGSPDAPETAAVRRYLREFLSDPRVIALPTPLRLLLLYLVILPFRPRRSAEAYQKVWTDEGSPLLVHSRELTRKVQASLGDEAVVALAMRYGRPSIPAGLDALEAAGVERIRVLPLYPQYASSSWGSTAEAVFAALGGRTNVPPLELVPPFFDDPGFVAAFAGVARPLLDELAPDRVLMSFHGLPESHMRASDPTGAHCLARPDCCAALVEANRYCYRAQCFATARALARALDLPPERYEVAFQSRLGREPWIRPYTDERVLALPAEGVKRVAVLCPAFVADCLETLEEIGLRAAEDFRAAGGEELRLVPSLNAEDAWVEAVVGLARGLPVEPPSPPAI